MTHRERLEIRKQIAEYLKNHTRIQTMEKFDASRSYISLIIKEFGLKVPFEDQIRFTAYPTIALIQNTDFSFGEIARKLHCSRQAVSQVAGKMRDNKIKFVERI